MTSSPSTAVLERRPAPPAPAPTPAARATIRAQAALVVNPSKFADPAHLARFRRAVDAVLGENGWAPARWLPTTPTSRGADEARRALAEDVDLVLVAGGDGTVRTVAQELVGTPVPLGILPVGTGNLLARNLGVPLRDVRAAVAVAISGSDRRIDVGWLELDPDGGGGDDDRTFAFLVMAGAGFDAAVMAGADPALKARLGPSAYLLSGARALRRRRSGASVIADGTAVLTADAHGFVVGNCGSLTMGVQLMPDADPADGILDAVVFLPATIAEWLRVGWAVASRRPAAQRLMPRYSGRRVEYRSAEPQQVEVDGDVVGTARRVIARVQRSALVVRAQ